MALSIRKATKYKDYYQLNIMRVRTAVAEDSVIVGKVHSKAWKSAYRGIFPDKFINDDTSSKRSEEFLESIKDGSCTYFLLEESDNVAGIVKTREANNVLEIESIYILNEYRGKGFGREFMNSIKTYGSWSCIFLWVLESNTNARRFYENNGFVLSGKSRMISRGIELKQLQYVI